MSEAPTSKVPIEALRPGDLLFLRSADSLGRMITRLDGSDFSHVGMVAEPGIMVSARTNRHVSYAGVDDVDLGGVRLNSIADLLLGATPPKRTMAAARPKTTMVDPDRALAKALELLEIGTVHRSRFSYLKLFLVATALDSYTGPGKEQLLVSAVAAARAWEAHAQAVLRQQPSFFCSELIAVLFDEYRFQVDELRPPPAPDNGAATDGVDGVIDVIRLARRLADEAGHPSREQVATVARVVRDLATYDPPFLRDVFEELHRLLKDRLGREGRSVDEPATDAPQEELDASAPLPYALVTPRMLWTAKWVTHLGEVGA
ncbi:MAG TPA: hypothetical protein VGB14_12295 [Acidimicrobiales bacterium]|jgi:hypothetical protein